MKTNTPTLEFLYSRCTHPVDGCWEWQPPPNSEGYGQLTIRCVYWLAHRLSWVLHNGLIPDGFWVLHTCDNRRCIRPDHLFLGDADANNKDRAAKGRSNNVSRADPELLREMRRHYFAGSRTLTELGAAYGFSVSRTHALIVGLHQ